MKCDLADGYFHEPAVRNILCVPESEARMRAHTIDGGANLKLHVRDFGPEGAPPLLLIHGWSQHHLCWLKQFESPLAEEFRLIAMDLRGHGQSEAPPGPEAYTTGSLWADDIAAVISSLGLDSPVLVGSSYGGIVIGDYLRAYGDGAIGAVNLIGGAVGVGPDWIGPLIGEDFPKYAVPAAFGDPDDALRAVPEFVHCCIKKDLPPGEFELAVAWSMLTPAHVRGHLISRDDDFRPEYARLTKPLLVSYGTQDTIVLPAMAATIRGVSPSCQMSEYPGAGHFPFLEVPMRFNEELAEFARTSTSV